MTPADVFALMDSVGMPPPGPAASLDDDVRDHLHAAAALLRAATTLDSETARTYVRAAGIIVEQTLRLLDDIDGRE